MGSVLRSSEVYSGAPSSHSRAPAYQLRPGWYFPLIGVSWLLIAFSAVYWAVSSTANQRWRFNAQGDGVVDGRTGTVCLIKDPCYQPGQRVR